MGDFRVEVRGTGAHGCHRDVLDGGTVYGCNQMSCPDCITAEYVAKLARAGVMLKTAALVHWPGEPGEVVDEFNLADAHAANKASRLRRGSF